MARRSDHILRTAAVAALAGALLCVGPLAHAGAGSGSAQDANSVHRTSSRTMHGEVLNAGSSSFQLLAAHNMPITVTVGAGTRITLADIPGTMADIQNGRFVDVSGRYDKAQQAFSATRVTVVVPRVAGRVTGTNGATFTMLTGRGITYQVTTSSSTQFLALGAHARHSTANADIPATVAPPAIATGVRVIVQGFPPAAGSNAITALRVWVGTPRTAHGGGTSGTDA